LPPYSFFILHDHVFIIKTSEKGNGRAFIKVARDFRRNGAKKRDGQVWERKERHSASC
jgi:hypothetical protein